MDRPEPDVPGNRSAGAPPELLGESPAIVALRMEVARLVQRGRGSRRFPPILIQGETGTGKGLLARTLHQMGPRASRPFVDIDCTAIPETLLEGELFGFEQGAFTDARRAKTGLFQTAHGGTLFLDEIGPVPLSLQRKLLKAIEERVVRPLGSTRRETVDVWITAATNEGLVEAVEAGRFREDLYYRLAGVTFWIPPLRERGHDTLLLAEHFLERACADYGAASKVLARDARDALMSYPWPGNVRELANVMERVVLLSDAPIVTADLLGLSKRSPAVSPARIPEAVIQRRAKTLTRAQVTDALRLSGMKLAVAAALLGVPRNSLRYQLVKLGIPLKAALPALDHTEPDGVPDAREAPRRDPSDWTSLRIDVPGGERWPVALLFLQFVPREGVSSLQFGAPVRLAIDKIVEHGGTVSLLDDWGVRAVFAPETGERPASNAARAALAVMKALARAPEAERVARLSAGLDVDSGENDGNAVPTEGDAADTLIRHARALARAGEPGAILVTRRAGSMLARKFSLERVIIGQEGPALEGYRLVARKTVLDEFRGSAMTPLVGRAEELDSLVRMFETIRVGHCHVVGIQGEAGLGKSRVLYEFKRRLEGQSVTWIVAHCLPRGVSGRASVINDIIAGMLGIEEGDDPRTVAQKVRLGVEGGGIPDLQPGMADDLLRFLDVLPPSDRFGDPSPEAVRQRVLETFTHLARERSARRPLILAFEDMHWIDHDSEEFLFHVAERLASSPLMILCSHRPEYRLPAYAKANVTELPLPPLSRQDSAELVRYVAANQSMEPSTLESIIERGSGSPLFLEELTVMAVSGRARPGVVPVTIRAALLARVAALGPRLRRVLLAGAVLGPALRENVLATMLDHPAGLMGDLLELEELGLLGVTEGPGLSRLRFRHGLLQEVVYDALVPSERAALHSRSAAALERLHGDAQVPEGLADELARHHAGAGQERQAIAYLLVSVKHAYERYALKEALERLERAEALTARLAPGPERDARAVELAVRKSWPLAQLGRLEQARDVLLQQLGTVADVDKTPMAGEYYFGLATAFDRLGDHRVGAAWAVRAAVEATRTDSQALLGRSHHALALTNFSAGHFDLGVEHGVEAVERLDQAGDRWWAGRARWSFGMNYLGLGDLTRAVELEREAKRIGVETRERRLEADATLALGWAQALVGDAGASRKSTREACRLAPDPLVRAIAIAARGGALLEAGRFTSAVPVLQVAVSQLRAFKARPILSLAAAFLGEALAATDAVRAQAIAEEALTAAAEAGFPFGAGWAQRALSTVARERGHLARARDHATKALHVFAGIGARFEWARTSLSLAAIDHVEGDHEACARHVRGALAAFEVLGLSYWAARARELAASMQIGVPEALVRAPEPPSTGTALGA